MNDDLKEFADILFAPRERDELKQRIDKAIEYIEELISDTKGTLNDMRYCDGDDGNGYYGSGYWITVNLEGEYYEKE